jgi:hypothetical protein
MILSALHAQTSDAWIEIAGVRMRPGITVSDVLVLLEGKQVVRHGSELYVETSKTYPGGKTLNGIIVGTIYLDKDIVTGACKTWDYGENFDPPDSELARVLFAAINASGSNEGTQNAVLETSVDRTARYTAETLLINLGQRSIRVTRTQSHVAPITPTPLMPSVPPGVSVDECVWKPGWTMSLKH